MSVRAVAGREEIANKTRVKTERGREKGEARKVGRGGNGALIHLIALKLKEFWLLAHCV